MHFLKHVRLFLKTNVLQLKRKWKSLPLLLLFPIIIIGLLGAIIISLLSLTEDEPISVGLIDLDQSTETELVINLMEESSELSSFIQMYSMNEEDAVNALEQDEISTYIIFPDEFTQKLYTGQSVELTMIGNPERALESQLVREIVESVTRHINVSQANILTINHYAKELGMDTETRSDLVFDQFKEFLFFTLGKDSVLNQEEITNNVTASPLYYYSLGTWFILITVWLFIFYSFLYKDDSLKMRQRMQLYGVTELAKIVAKIMVTITVVSVIGTFTFGIFIQVLHNFEVLTDNYVRIAMITFLYSIIYLVLLALLELAIRTSKFRLLIQSIVTVFILLCSGAILPSIYLPTYMQGFLTYLFSNQAFQWLEELILNGRFYVDYIPLLLMSLTSVFVLIGYSLWKERGVK
ncbi:ABC transporter permease [Ornithinibacillus sp. L9]|uniref:ABC transporter permease n=1 Tax=Ornithinibacillus caprae TaxID=2678566 RepID=A0A6N8FCL3_9BACI|nr:ABC transporter permease [Ornithinibacillus caprae]MUK86911.1 ABC transporter permease [Ornithinibacillus caprae]